MPMEQFYKLSTFIISQECADVANISQLDIIISGKK